MATAAGGAVTSRQVMVIGIPEGTNAGFLKLFFKNKSKTGGGEVENMDYQEGEECAVLTFKQEEVAKRVLEKKTVLFRDATLTLKPMEWDQKSVLVQGCGEDPQTDYLELLFESEEDSGGGPVENIDVTDCGVIITFQQTEDALRVLEKRTVKSENGELTVSLPTPQVDMWDGKTVEVTGFDRTLKKDELELIYEDKDWSGGGAIQNMKVDYDEAVAVIVFEQEEDAEEVLQKSPLSWSEHTLTARKPRSKSKSKKEKSSKRLLVSGFTSSSSHKILELFFKNGGKSGGGPIKSLRVNDSKDKCAIEFEDEKIVDSVIKKHETDGLSLAGNSLTVDKCDANEVDTLLATPVKMPKDEKTETEETLEKESKETGTSQVLEEPKVKTQEPPKESTKPEPPVQVEPVPVQEVKEEPKIVPQTRALEVAGLPDVSDDTLRMFFEVEKYSGGGPVESHIVITGEQKAVITFKKVEVCARVHERYCKEGLNLEGKDIRVSLMQPISREVDTTDPLEPDLVSLEGVEEGITSPVVVRYFEDTLTLCTVKTVTFGTKDGTALVEFKKFPGYALLYELACQRPLGRKMVKLDGVIKSASVEVYGVEGMSNQKIQMYFEHPKSKGGNVSDVELVQEHKCAVVIFEDYEVAKRVLDHRAHQLENKRLIVKKHYECIGVIPPDFDTSGIQKPPPDVNEMVDDDRIISYLMKHPRQKDKIEQEMTLHDAVVLWRKSTIAKEVIISYKPQTKVRSIPKSEDWSRAVKEHFSNLLAELEVVDIPIQSEYWEEFYDMYKNAKHSMSALTRGRSDDLEVEVNQASYVVTVIGPGDAVDERKSEIEQMEDEAVEIVQKRKNIVEENFELGSSVKMKMLALLDFFTEIEQKYEEMKIELDHAKDLVIITGQKDDVQKSKDAIFKKCNTIMTERFSISKQLASFAKSSPGDAHLQTKMKGQGVHTAWEVDVDMVRMSAFNGSELNKALDIFNTSILEETISIPVTGAAMLETNRWATLPKDLQNTYGEKLIVKLDLKGQSYSVQIIGCDDVFAEAVQSTKTFIDNNSIQHDFVAVSSARFNYIREYMRDELDNQVEKHRRKHQMKIKFSPIPAKTGFNIECNVQGLILAKSIVQTLQSKVIYEDHKVQKMGMSKYFADEKGQSYLFGLQAKHKVIIQKDEEIESDSATLTFTIHAKATFPSGKTLYLATGDLTKFTSDAIVNAADPKLDHGGGVAKAIVDAGGFIIQKECTDYIKRNGEMKPGDVYVSTAGTLPCTKVIHTVGPKWRGGRWNEETELFQAVYSPLEEASNLHMKCLSMPAISTGKYGFPQKSACDIIISAVGSFLGNRPHHSLQEVYIIDNNMEVIKSCCQSFSQFKSSGITIDMKVGSMEKTPAVVDTSGMAEYAAKGFADAKHTPAATAASNDWHRGTSNNQIVTSNGLRVSLVSGSIIDQQTDAVVNLTARSLDLTQGAVSQMILRKAGPGIQKECDRLCPHGISCGEVVSTSGGDSAWRKIYHSSVSQYSSTAQREMTDVVSKSLSKADSDGLSSIALPSLGTGSLRFPADKSASIIYGEILNFSITNKNTGVKDVKVVVFDPPVLKKFEDHMKALLQSKRAPSTRGHSKTSGDGKSSGGRSGSSNQWTQGPGQHNLTTAEGIQVLLIKGSIVDEQADVIVNLTSDDLNLSNGAVSKLILKKAGQGIQDECKQELTKYVTNCLNEAHTDGFSTIAFPSLGTGSLKFPSDEVAGIMYDKIREFSSLHAGTPVKTVKIVVFDEPVLKKFKSHIDDLASGKGSSGGAVPKHIRKPSKPAKAGSKTWKKGSHENEIVTGNGITVEVCGGDVVTQKVDAIVNLTSRNLDLSQGFISKDIVKKGGQKIQDELTKKRPGGIEYGEAVESRGGSLPCKAIYHGACPSYHHASAKNDLSRFVDSCLQNAHMAHHKSIAFPSLGTGSLKFPPADAATVMFKSVLEFGHKYTKTSLKQIKFVVYNPSDRQEFEKQQKYQLTNRTIRHLVKQGFDYMKEVFTGKSASIKPGDIAVGRRKETLFRIYGTSRAVLQQVIRQIDETCNKEIKEKVLESPMDQEAIAKLSTEQAASIQGLASIYDVNIDLQLAPVNKIRVEGLRENVHQVSLKIQDIFRMVDKQARHEEEVQLLSQQAQWQFKGAAIDEWEDYPDDVNAIIEKAHLHGDPFAQWDEKDDSSRQFKVRLDLDKKREFTIGGPSRNYKVRRQVEGTEGDGIVSLPDTWEDMVPHEPFMVKQVPSSSQEYSDVKATFDASMKRSNVSYKSIVEIQRVQNPRLYRTYMVTKAEMEAKHKSKNPLERTVWHATGKEVLNEINATGFNRSFSGDKHGAWYGMGVYFATEAGTSAKMYSGKGPQDRFMYQCKVLTGDFTKGEKGIKAPPPKDPTKPTVKYDSVVDRMANPIEWVVFSDSQCLAEYIITFTMP